MLERERGREGSYGEVCLVFVCGRLKERHRRGRKLKEVCVVFVLVVCWRGTGREGSLRKFRLVYYIRGHLKERHRRRRKLIKGKFDILCLWSCGGERL